MSTLIKSLERSSTPAIRFNFSNEIDDTKLSIFKKSHDIDVVVITGEELLRFENFNEISSYIFNRQLAIDLNISDLEIEELK